MAFMSFFEDAVFNKAVLGKKIKTFVILVVIHSYSGLDLEVCIMVYTFVSINIPYFIPVKAIYVHLACKIVY